MHKIYRALFLIGEYGMMVGFGALFANTIMTRVGFLDKNILAILPASTIRCLNSAYTCCNCNSLGHEAKIAKGKLL